MQIDRHEQAQHVEAAEQQGALDVSALGGAADPHARPPQRPDWDMAMAAAPDRIKISGSASIPVACPASAIVMMAVAQAIALKIVVIVNVPSHNVKVTLLCPALCQGLTLAKVRSL